MHVVVGGASGFLGTALVSHLRESGKRVTRLVRKPEDRSDASVWDPAAGLIEQRVIDSADVVVNLSGESITHWPPTKRWQEKVLASRVSATSTLARAIAHAPKPPSLLSASGMSYYGADRGDEILTETSDAGDGLLSEVVHAWEAAAETAAEAGAHVCLLRTTAALDRTGGLLKAMLPAFRIGLGARIGDGQQFMSVISRDDWVRAVTFLAERDDLSGPFNLAMPDDTTNDQFTEALAAAVGRRRLLVAPRPILRVASGPLADDFLGSLRVRPKALVDAGFSFNHPDLASLLDAAL